VDLTRPEAFTAAALTHGLQPVPTPALFERVDECRHDAGTAGSERATDGDSAAVDVGLGQVSTGVVSPGQYDGVAARR
jgi:hypothetical protein